MKKLEDCTHENRNPYGDLDFFNFACKSIVKRDFFVKLTPPSLFWAKFWDFQKFRLKSPWGSGVQPAYYVRWATPKKSSKGHHTHTHKNLRFCPTPTHLEMGQFEIGLTRTLKILFFQNSRNMFIFSVWIFANKKIVKVSFKIQSDYDTKDSTMLTMNLPSGCKNFEQVTRKPKKKLNTKHSR